MAEVDEQFTPGTVPDRTGDPYENDTGSVLEALEALPLTGRLRRPMVLLTVARVKSRRRRGRTGRARRPRWWRRGQLSPHFHLREFYCKDGTRPRRGRWRTYKYWCNVIGEPMRAEFGPCTVTSGYRTPSWNTKVGGERGSFHVNDWHDVDDVAVDAQWARGTPQQWAAKIARIRANKRRGRGGIGRYRTFVHSDTRDYRADWTG